MYQEMKAMSQVKLSVFVDIVDSIYNDEIGRPQIGPDLPNDIVRVLYYSDVIMGEMASW